jgi:hypothetical protein
MGVSWAAAASMSPEISRRPVAAQIEREFSGVVAWYGTVTQAWWAMVRVRGGHRLVEAKGPSELREAIVNARGWTWPR